MGEHYKLVESAKNLDCYLSEDEDKLTTGVLRSVVYGVYARQVKNNLDKTGKRSTIIARSNLEKMLLDAMLYSIKFTLVRKALPEDIRKMNLSAVDLVKAEYWGSYSG